MCITKGTTRGSVLVITIIVTAVLLSIGITLATILEKEISRQVYARQSQIAMNVANSALECALFNDFYRSVFRSAALAERVYAAVECGDLYPVRKISDWSSMYDPSSGDGASENGGVGGPPGTGLYTFVVIDSDGKPLFGEQVPCAHVALKKECVAIGDDSTVCQDGLIDTSIEVKGYSLCRSGESESARELVRRFRVHY